LRNAKYFCKSLAVFAGLCARKILQVKSLSMKRVFGWSCIAKSKHNMDQPQLHESCARKSATKTQRNIEAAAYPN
jgi:hypothetical protein